MSEELQEKPPIMPFVSLAATLVATGALHYHLENNDEPHGPRLPVAEFTVDSTTQSETTPVGPGREQTTSVPVEAEPSQETSVTLVYPVAEYARLFDEDPAVLEIDTSAANEVKRSIDQMVADGWTVSVTVQGNASGEDDTPDGEGGMQTPSQKNIDLANARRDAFASYLTDAEVIPEGVDVQMVEGNEVATTGRDAAVIIGLSEQFGYESAEAMIEAWNRGEEVPPLAAETLNSFLGKNRNVMVMITGERAVAGSDDEIEQVVCVIPVKETVTETEEKQPWEVTVPWIVPIVIPRRRRNQQKGVSKDGIMMPISVTAELEAIARTGRRLQTGNVNLADTTKSVIQAETVPADVTTAKATPKLSDDTLEPENTPDGSTSSNPQNGEEGVPAGDVTAEESEPEKKKRRLKPILFIAGGITLGLTALGVGIGLSQQDDENPGGDENTPQLSRDDCDPQLPKIEEIVDKEVVEVTKRG